MSVQYNGGLLPDIILLTRCGYIGEPVRYHEEALSLQPMFPPKPLDIFSPEGGCSEGLDAFRFFLNMYPARGHKVDKDHPEGKRTTYSLYTKRKRQCGA